MNAAWTLLWNLYGTYVPIYLQSGNPGFSNAIQSRGFGLSAIWASVFLSIDEVIGMFLGPLVGILSDRSRRRIPYVLGSAVLAIVGILALPLVVQSISATKSGHIDELPGTFALFFLAALCVIVGHASINSPDSCLKMELVPSEQRTKIMGFISTIGVVLSLGLLAVAPLLYKKAPEFPFIMAAVLTIAACICYRLFLHEPEGFAAKEDRVDRQKGLGRFIADFKLLLPEERRSLLSMLLCWFLGALGVNSTTTFASSYAINVLHLGEANTVYLVVACLAGSLVSYIPAGYLAQRFGRFPILRVGMLGLSSCGLIIFFFPVTVAVSIAIFLLGAFAAMITVTILPILSDIVTTKNMMGVITGAFVFVGLASAVIGNLICGSAIQATNSYNTLWIIVACGGVSGFLSSHLPRLGEDPSRAGKAKRKASRTSVGE